MNDTGATQAASLLRRGLAQLNIALSELAVTSLSTYCSELRKWNRKVNLVARNTSLEEVVEKHFLDSLTLVPVLGAHAPENGMLLDVGSGAGFPGLVVKTACPEFPVILLEPRLRRVSFLNHVIRLLLLTGIEVVACRTDQVRSLPGEPCRVITGRAVADVGSFLEMVAPLAKPGTLVACMQGPSGIEQWAAAKDNPLFERMKREDVRLPFSRARRTILLFRKKM